MSASANQQADFSETAPNPACRSATAIAGCVAWTLIALWLWLGAPPGGKALGLAWFLLGFVSLRHCLLSLGVALAWFGNNPGGEHALYLLELGLMGLVAGDQWRRARGLVFPKIGALDGWIRLFVLYSWVTLLPQWRHVWTELYFTKIGFLYANYNHFGTSDTFGLQVALKLTLAWGLYLALRDHPWKEKGMKEIWRWMLAMAGASALIGLLNYFDLLSLRWWRGENPDVTSFGFRRLQSLYWHPGWYAQYVIALAPGALALGWVGSRGKTRILWLALAAVFALSIFLTMQRAGWIGNAAGFVTVALLAPSIASAGQPARGRLGRAIKYVAISMLPLLLLAGLLWVFSETFRDRAAELPKYEHRTEIWRGAWGMIMEHPLGGVGLGNYFVAHKQLYSPGHPLWNLHDKVDAHNLWLQLAAERGLVGLILFCIVLAGVYRRMWQGWRSAVASRSPTAWARLAMIGGLTALMFNGLFQGTFYVRTIEILFWLFLGWSAGLDGQLVRKRPDRSWGKRLATVALLTFMAAWIARDHRYSVISPYFWIDSKAYSIHGAKATLPLADGERRWAFWLASADPSLAAAPVTLRIALDGQTLHELTFTTHTPQLVLLELPDAQGSRRRLEVTASRCWSPFLYGWRGWPVPKIGILCHGLYPHPMWQPEWESMADVRLAPGDDPIGRASPSAAGK